MWTCRTIVAEEHTKRRSTIADVQQCKGTLEYRTEAREEWSSLLIEPDPPTNSGDNHFCNPLITPDQS